MKKTLNVIVSQLVLVMGIGQVQSADLLDVYEQARASDPQLSAAEASWLAGKEDIVQARSRLLPSINGQADLNNSEGNSTFIDTIPQADGSVRFGAGKGSSDTTSRNYQIALQQSIYNHGNYTQLKASKALSSKNAADYAAAKDALIARVADAYFNALTMQANMDAAQAEEKAVARQLEQAEQRFEVGLTAITDVHEARAQYDGAKANVILAQNQLDDAYEVLIELTGKEVGAIVPLKDKIEMSLPEPANPEKWVETALDQNPTLAANRFTLEATQHNIATAKSGHYPYLSMNASYGNNALWGSQSSSGFTFPASQAQEGTSIGLTLTVPMFSGFAVQSAVRQAVYQRDASEDQLEATRRSIVRQTRNAYRAVQAGISAVTARQQALVSAQSALDATQAGFEVGTRTIVDVLLSQQLLFAAQREYASARHQYIVAGLALKQAAGVIDVKDLRAVNQLLGQD